METFAIMLQKYPLLTSWKSNTYWTGFIAVQDQLLRLTIHVPKYPFVSGGSIHSDHESVSAYALFKNEIKQLFSRQSFTLVSFLDGLVQLLGNSGDNESHREGTRTVMVTRDGIDEQFYAVLLDELEKIGFENIVHISNDYREINIRIFVDGREHEVYYQLSSKYPNVPINVGASVPATGELENKIWPHGLVECNYEVCSQLMRFDSFWKEVEHLDSNVIVIDPVRPSRNHSYRRIKLSEQVNIKVDINPLRPRGFPEITFLGPEELVQELENDLEKNCQQWSDERTVLDNLEFILEIEFPQKNADAVDSTDPSASCIVCLTYELGTTVPDRKCECGACYHDACILELLKSEFSTDFKRTVDCVVCQTELRIHSIPAS